MLRGTSISQPVYRVGAADLEAARIRLAPDADFLTRQVAELAVAYFGAVDAGDIEAMLSHLHKTSFDIHVLAPDAHLTSEQTYRAWYDRITGEFSRLHHTIIKLTAEMLSSDRAQAELSIHSEVDLRSPSAGAAPRANVTLDIVWELVRDTTGAWVITVQRATDRKTPAFSTIRAREFAVSYLQALDRRDLPAMLALLAPPSEINIALNQGLIIENFPEWFQSIDQSFVNSVHRVQGLVAMENPDGTIDAFLKIHFTADARHPQPEQPSSVDFSVERIWTIRSDASGAPQLISQRPFRAFDLGTRIDPLDIDVAITAVRNGETEAVRDWLRRGGDPNASGRDGFNLFLAAAAAGQIEILRLMLVERVGLKRVDPAITLKDPARPSYNTGISATHLACQKGDVNSTLLLLARFPEQLHARIEVNGHTPLLQAAFYGHVDLAQAILDCLSTILPEDTDRASEIYRLFSATTLRGLNATQLGRQFGNSALVAVLSREDTSTEESRAADTKRLLIAIPAGSRHPDAGLPIQELSETVFQIITAGLAEVAGLTAANSAPAITRIVGELKSAIANPAFDPDRLCGDLLQTPLIVAVTGTDVHAGVTALRLAVVETLLGVGADPDKEEMYPMAVDAVIRAAVFNHLECLRQFAQVMTPEAMTRALNHRPAVNGLTALHDSVLRAATGAAGYLDQIRWMRGLGATADIPDHTGRTQTDYAAATFETAGQAENAPAIWTALGVSASPPKRYRVFDYANLTFLTIPDQVGGKGEVWRALADMPDMIVKNIDLDGPNAVSAEVIQNHGFGTATMNRCWPDGRPVEAQEVQAFAAQTRGTPLLPMMRFTHPEPYIKQLNGAGLFGALLVNPVSPSTVRAFMQDVYFPQRPSDDIAQKPSTAALPFGKRAVGADNIGQRTFAEYPKMMDLVNLMYLGGLSFSQPAVPEVLKAFPALKQIGVRIVEIDAAGIRQAISTSRSQGSIEGQVVAAITEIEVAAREAGIVLSGAFGSDDSIREAFNRGYRHITVITETQAQLAAWRTWLPKGSPAKGRAPLPREMPIRPPSDDFNDVRRAISAGELVVFGAQTTPNLTVAMKLARSGILNAIALEREHGTWSTDEAVRHIKALKGHSNVMVRTLSALDPDIGIFVELGVSALIATAVRDASEAEQFLKTVEKANIATHGADDRCRWTVPAIMMETVGAAADTEKIVALLKQHGGVCHPGPLDLSASLGAAWGTEKYESTLRKIEQTALAAGVPIAGVLNSLEDALDKGFGMVLAPMGMDAGALNAGIMGTNPLQSLQGTNSAR
jgi:2-keto-3-deoxy-L-rhamnonate aldolase RhmA